MSSYTGHRPADGMRPTVKPKKPQRLQPATQEQIDARHRVRLLMLSTEVQTEILKTLDRLTARVEAPVRVVEVPVLVEIPPANHSGWGQG